jgi:glycosyltransferase involved in cell wall biosynthesis
MRSKIRVLALFLHDSMWGRRIRGDERRFLEIAKRLVKYGADLYVIEFVPSLQKPYYHADIYKSFELKARKLLYTITWLMMMSLKFKNYDIIYSYNQDLLNLLASFIFKLIWRKPLVIVIQSLQDLELPLRSLKQMYGVGVLDFTLICLYKYLLFPLALRLTNVIFTVSNFLKTQLTMKYSWAKEKVFITFNGVDLYKFRPLNLKKEYDLIFLGRVHILHKGINKLLLIWKQVVHKHHNAKLILVGGFESDRDKELVFGLVDRLNLRNNVIITGFVKDEEIVQLLNKAKIFVSLSTYEGFGLSILEALACGLPIIASSLKVFHELHKDLLFYVSNENLKDLVTLLNKFLTSTSYNNLTNSLTKTLRKHARNFTWDSVACREFMLMKKLVSYRLKN